MAVAMDVEFGRHPAVGGRLTQEWATQERPDGHASFWGVNGEVDHSFGDTLDGLFWWSYDNESYDDERPDFTTDPDLLLKRNDDLWHFGASLVWGFARGWSLRPTIEYNWEDSNIDELAYSSTEMWLTIRKSFQAAVRLFTARRAPTDHGRPHLRRAGRALIP